MDDGGMDDLDYSNDLMRASDDDVAAPLRVASDKTVITAGIGTLLCWPQ
jgi:hypothetical protein